MRFIPIVFALLLAGCATTNNVPTGDKCIIPDALMLKAPRLPILTPDKKDKASLNYMFDMWLEDINHYNHLKSKDDALIDWTEKYCRAAPLSSKITGEPAQTPPKQPTLFGN